MDKQSEYAENQRVQYNNISETMEGARKAVGPDYDKLRSHSPAFARFVLFQYFMRRLKAFRDDAEAASAVSSLRVLDFGCGIGRVMEGFVEAGVQQVDGVDISEAMLNHAKSSPLLGRSRFYLSNGMDIQDQRFEGITTSRRRFLFYITFQ